MHEDWAHSTTYSIRTRVLVTKGEEYICTIGYTHDIIMSTLVEAKNLYLRSTSRKGWCRQTACLSARFMASCPSMRMKDYASLTHFSQWSHPAIRGCRLDCHTVNMLGCEHIIGLSDDLPTCRNHTIHITVDQCIPLMLKTVPDSTPCTAQPSSAHRG